MRIERRPEGQHAWKITLSLEGEKDVSRLWVFDRQMRWGSALLRMGGVGGVGTKETHRMKGYARRVMEDSTDFMREQGFDVAMLFGIANFYPKYGYATVLPETWVELNAADALEANPSYQIRPFQKSDTPKVLAIYADNNRERTGAVVRSANQWIEFNKGSSFREKPAPFVVLNASDEVIGYFVCDDTDKHCKLAEVGFEDRRIFETIVRFLGDRASSIKEEQISCSMPADHPFAVFCRRYGARTIIRAPKNSGCMMRVINPSSMFQKITGELERRLKRSAAFSQWSGKIQITTELGTDSLVINQGRISHTTGNTDGYRLEIPQDKLMQLMMGRRNINDLAIDADVLVPSEGEGTVNAEILPLLDTLFPVCFAHVWWPDRF